MTHVYIAENITEKSGKDSFVKSVLLRHTTAPVDILYEESGKPYLKDNPVYFNIAHSDTFCTIAVGGSPVGVDMEVYGRGIRKAVMSSFGAAEQEEICSERDFLAHWTARETYIKYTGGTLAGMLKYLDYTGGILQFKGRAVTPQPQFYFTDKFVLAVCCEDKIDNDITYAVL